MRQAPAPSGCKTRLKGIRGRRGIFPFQQSPMAWKKNGLASVCRIAQGLARGRGLARQGDKGEIPLVPGWEGLPRTGDVGIHHYCFLLGQKEGARVGVWKGVRRTLRGDECL